MAHLTHEASVWESEAQRVVDRVAEFNATAAREDQTAADARARAAALRADAPRLSGEAATLRSQAAAADATAADLDRQIEEMRQSEPDPFFEPVLNKPPRPNPAWKAWKATVDSLIAQRDAARAAAATARAQANDRDAAAARSLADAAGADSAAAAAAARAAQLRQQAAQTATDKNPITEQLAAIKRWQDEIARDPLNAAAAEAAGGELAAAVAAVEAQQVAAIDRATTAERSYWALQTVLGELTMKIGDLNSQVLPAATEITNANAAVADLQTRILHVMQRKPE